MNTKHMNYLMSSCYSKKFCHKDKVSQHERLKSMGGAGNDRADHHIKRYFLSKVLMQELLLECKGKSSRM